MVAENLGLDLFELCLHGLKHGLWIGNAAEYQGGVGVFGIGFKSSGVDGFQWLVFQRGEKYFLMG